MPPIGTKMREFHENDVCPLDVWRVRTKNGAKYEQEPITGMWHRIDDGQVAGHKTSVCPGVSWQFLATCCGPLKEAK